MCRPERPRERPGEPPIAFLSARLSRGRASILPSARDGWSRVLLRSVGPPAPTVDLPLGLDEDGEWRGERLLIFRVPPAVFPALFSTEKHTEYCEHCEEGTGTNNRIVIELRAGPDDHVLDRGYSCALCWTAHVWTDAD